MKRPFVTVAKTVRLIDFLAHLLCSLDEAMRAVDAGKGIDIENVRKRLPSSVARQYSRFKPSPIWSV
jgi:hypothetical protein